MATGGGDTGDNLYQLLPSDLNAVRQAEEYAKEEGNELNTLTVKVQNMGFWRQFLDSKVAEKDKVKGYFNISFTKSDPSEIQNEIEKFLEFYENVVDAAIKVNDGKKTEAERENPLRIIIELNERLVEMFDVAKSGLETTTSKTVTQLYRKFLSKQMELENKLKRLECAYLKQQFATETRKRQEQSGDVKKSSDDVAAYKEKSFTNLLEEIHFRKKHNLVLQELLQDKKFAKKEIEEEE